ncbi:helix-turn-helix domain-containing protein [Dictyobacter kobayashii]|uniref:Helix-turn-helix domain-containing protein n=1 Tax=Dictyobacter kobayashii TaxID=2014872 RepID=A0A402ABB4_9CHLR|nr:helix-turn-helix domain-containing protein [Dictyobacter kobayashii]GCE16291.1 hypothetical protein KDK_00910 [Dictyobacter kobayashii]
MTQKEPLFLNIYQAAAFLGVNPNTIKRWTREKKLAGKQVGTQGGWLFSKEALLQTVKDEHLPIKNPHTHNTNGDSKLKSTLDFLSGGGEMGELIRTKDWSKTSLGPAENWPQSLKTIVRIMLTSRQPIWIGWGPDLIMLYNDPYKSIVGGKHPTALGQPTSVVWQEIWDSIEPRLQRAMRDNEGTYDEGLLLIMERHGYQEETYYTFSYSPVPADDGGVGELFVPIQMIHNTLLRKDNSTYCIPLRRPRLKHAPLKMPAIYAQPVWNRIPMISHSLWFI